MVIESVSGCMCDSLTIDGTETVDMDTKDIKVAINKLLDLEDDMGTLQSILIDLVERRGDYEDLGRCEDCGDYICKCSITV